MKKLFVLLMGLAILSLSLFSITGFAADQDKNKKSRECFEAGKSIERILTSKKGAVLGVKIENHKLLVWEKTSSTNGNLVLFRIPLDFSGKISISGDSLILSAPGITRTFEKDDKEAPFPVFSFTFSEPKKIDELIGALEFAQTVCR